MLATFFFFSIAAMVSATSDGLHSRITSLGTGAVLAAFEILSLEAVLRDEAIFFFRPAAVDGVFELLFPGREEAEDTLISSYLSAPPAEDLDDIRLILSAVKAWGMTTGSVPPDLSTALVLAAFRIAAARVDLTTGSTFCDNFFVADTDCGNGGGIGGGVLVGSVGVGTAVGIGGGV